MAIAFFHTWTTYGTWLPGDSRGWYQHDIGPGQPNPLQNFCAQLCMNDTALILDDHQRALADSIILNHCQIRGWALHAKAVRTNHVHVVVAAGAIAIERPREQFKSWCTRGLKPTQPVRMHWWADRGWDVYIDDDDHLAKVTRYVEEGQ